MLDDLGSGAKTARTLATALHPGAGALVRIAPERLVWWKGWTSGSARGMTTVEFSVEVDAPPEIVWTVASDPRNLPQWDKHIVRVDLPEGGMQRGATYDVVMGLIGVQTTVHATVLEWEPPWRSLRAARRTDRGDGHDLGRVAAVRPVDAPS